MDIAAKLCVENLTYRDVMNEYRLLSDAHIHEIRKRSASFVDWLVDPSVNNFSLANTKKFRRLLQSVIKQKLEILLTAVGPVPVEETPMRLLRSNNFVSVDFLKGLFLAEKGFELTQKDGKEFVKASAVFSGKPELKTHNFKTTQSTQQNSNVAQCKKFPSIAEDATVSECSELERSSNDADANQTLHESSLDHQAKDCEDARSKQLRFLFQCQPDVIAALQPTLCVSDLFKSYSFWKSYCTHNQSSLVAWLLDLAEFKYSSASSTVSFSQYDAALKAAIAVEVRRYVSEKPKNVKELVNLVSKGQSRLVDESFLMRVIKENPDICETNSQGTLANPQYTTAYRKQQLEKMDGSKSKTTNTVQAKTTVNPHNLTVIETSFYQTWEIRGVFVPKDIRAKILPLLTMNVNWNFLVSVLKKIASERKKFESELVSAFDSFVEFLIEFAEKFKPSLNITDYTNHLRVILTQQVESCLEVPVEKPLMLNDLFFSLQCEKCELNLLHRSFLLKAMPFLSHKFHLVGDTVSHSSVSDLSVPVEQTRYFSLEELVKFPQIHELLSTEFGFSDFVHVFERLSDNVKESIRRLSLSFYSLLLQAASFSMKERGFTRNYLKQMVVQKIENLFRSSFVTSFALMDVQIRLCCDNLSLIYCPDIRDAIEAVSGYPTNLVVEGSWVHFKETLNKSQRSIVAQPCNQSSHFSFINSYPVVQRYINEIESALARDESFSKRLAKLFFFVKNVPYPLDQHLQSMNISWFHFILDVLPNKDYLYAVLKFDLCNYLKADTLFWDDLLQVYFRDVPAGYMTSKELLDFLKYLKDTFVVVEHHQVGKIVSLVRQPDANGKVLFFGDFEETLFAMVLDHFPKFVDDVCFSHFFTQLWNYNDFLPRQRAFVFGLQPSHGPIAFHEIHFRRYIMMHPSVFFLREDRICLCTNRSTIEVADSPLPDAIREEGQIVSADELSVQPTQAVNRLSPTKKKKHKKKKKKRFSKKLSTAESAPGVLHDLISSLPNHLIQDVAVGRLMSSESHMLKVKNLTEMLGASLLRDKKATIWEKSEMLDLFNLKVLSVLQNGSQFVLSWDEIENEQNVCLILNMPSGSKPSAPSVQVFRWISKLTGISHQKLSAYIFKVLEISNKPLNLSIIFTMIAQKYGSKMTFPNTPNEVLHCQAVACMMKDQSIFINYVKKTCALKKWIGKNEEASDNLLKFMNDVSQNKISSSIINYLEEDGKQNGLTVDEITAKVANNFEEKFPTLSLGAFRLIVQSLVAESQQYGFNCLGKVCRRFSSSDSSGVPEEKDDSSSGDDIKMEIVEEEVYVYPDSTKCDYLEEDSDPAGNSEEQMDTGVIRCNFVSSPTNEYATADSTTSITQEELSTSEEPDIKTFKSPPTDPRLKGKLFQSVPRTANNDLCNNSNSLEKPSEKIAANPTFTVTTAFKKRHHLERYEMIKSFAIDFFTKNGYSFETQIFIDQAYQRFKNERFARSMLACEAFVRDFIATSSENLFSFGNRIGGVGVTWTFYRPVRTEVNYRAQTSVPCLELLPDVLNVVYAFVKSKPQKKVDLQAVCERVADCFSRSFEILETDEVLPVCRNLVLIACIRNLQYFFFGKVQPIVYVREKVAEASSSRDPCNQFRVPVTVQPNSDNEGGDLVNSTATFYTPSVAHSPASSKPKHSRVSSAAKCTFSALKQMADILRQYGPIKKSVLRDLWSNKSDNKHRKVFGTGVSFSLSLRKFETYFPITNSGKVYVNEVAFEKFLKENHMPKELG